MNTVINGIFGWTTRFWGWLYLVTAFLLVLACFALMGNTYGVESAIFAIAQHLPLSGLLAVCLIFLITTFFLTSANSAAVSLAMFVSGHETPGRNLRAFWGIALGAVAAVLAGGGSLKAIQTASIETAFPLMFLLLLVIYGTFKGLNAYRQDD